MNKTDSELIKGLAEDDEDVYRHIFRSKYEMMYASAIRLTKSPDLARDACQEVFLELWKKRKTLKSSTNIGAYLRVSVINRSLNKIKSSKLHRLAIDPADLEIGFNNETPDLLTEANELQHKIHATINTLPDRCREVFILSRYEDLKYMEIADKLQISVRTVENHISKALRLLRKAVYETN